MMKKITFISIVSLLLFLLAGIGTTSDAQLRSEANRNAELMGPITKQADRSDGANLSNLFNMQMNHSYSMMFSSFGGQFQNMNAYTNTMHFFFSDDLTGRVDLSVLHSPFGNSMMSPNSGGMDTQLLIQNAELNYQISDRSNIRIQFQQVPSHGMGPWSSGMHRSPFGSPFSGRNF